MRIIVDTNILMSAIFFDGLSEKLIDLVLQGAVMVVVSEEILREYENTTQNMILKTKRTDFNFSFISFLNISE